MDGRALRIAAGFKTLRQLPITGAALGFENSYWPVAYLYEWQDLIAQAEGEAEAPLWHKNLLVQSIGFCSPARKGEV